MKSSLRALHLTAHAIESSTGELESLPVRAHEGSPSSSSTLTACNLPCELPQVRAHEAALRFVSFVGPAPPMLPPKRSLLASGQ